MRRRGLWAHDDFLRLWAASTVSVFGSLITRVALPFTAILLLAATPLQIAALSIAEMLPGFLLGLVAGAWVDRLRRRPIMVATDLGRAALLLAVPVAALTGHLTIPLLVAVAAGASVLTVFFDVAYQAYLPSLVARDELVEGNAKLTAAGAVAEAGAFSLGGVLVQALTGPIAILVDAVSFVASAFLVGRIRTPEPDPTARLRATDPNAGDGPGDGSGVLAEIVEGLALLRDDRTLLALAGGMALLAMAWQITGSVFLIFVTRELGFSPGPLGVIFAVGGVSSLVGALLARRLGRLGVGAVMTAMLLVAAIGQGVLVLAVGAGAVSVAILVAQQLVTDSALTVYDIHQTSLRQAITPEHMLGRITASSQTLATGAMLAGSLIGGVLGQTLGLRPTILVGTLAVLAAALWIFVSPVRRLRALPAAPVVADAA